jgi:hypothetical protein
MVATAPSDLRVVDRSWLWQSTVWVVLGLFVLGLGGTFAGLVSVFLGGGIVGFLLAAIVWAAALFGGVYLALRGLALLVRGVIDDEIFGE